MPRTSDSFERLRRQMEIEAFRVRSTIFGILAQRLVRVLCPHCKEPYTGTPYELEQLGIDPALGLSSRFEQKHPTGNAAEHAHASEDFAEDAIGATLTLARAPSS